MAAQVQTTGQAKAAAFALATVELERLRARWARRTVEAKAWERMRTR